YSLPIIFDNESETAAFEPQTEANFGSAGVFDDIVERLFKSQEEIIAQLCGQMKRWQCGRHIHPAADSRSAQKILSKRGDIVHQAIKSVVLRIYRPNDLINRARQLSRRIRDTLEMPLRLRGGVSPGQLAQQGDLGQSRAKIIVNVLGDASPIAFDRAL